MRMQIEKDMSHKPGKQIEGDLMANGRWLKSTRCPEIR